MAQTANAFSPDAADISAVRGYARAQGLKCMEVSLAGATIVLSGTVAQLNRAFGVKLVHRRDKKYPLPYLSHDEEVTLPAELKAVITGVFGLDTRPASRRPHRFAHEMSAQTTPPPPVTSKTRLPAEFAGLYNFPRNTSGKGQSIGLLEFGGGFTICCSAGDRGISECDGHSFTVAFPASSPHVLACGGTRLEVRRNGSRNETVWNQRKQFRLASGGGVSDVFPLPVYQQRANGPLRHSDNSSPGRGIPDVAANASSDTGYLIEANETRMSLGGTSAVAPLWAALVARLNEALGTKIAFLTPSLYKMNTATGAVFDIIRGFNGADRAHAFHARPGWDPCTGFGSPTTALAATFSRQRTITSMNEIQESNQTFHELWAMYARGLDGEVVEQTGILATWAGVQWPMVNVVFLSSPIQNVAQLRSRLEGVAAYTGRKKQFGMLVACDSWLPSREEAAPIFSEHGWVQISEGAGMVCEKPVGVVSVHGLEYRRVDSKELRQAAADINGVSYGVSDEMAREALDSEALWGEGCFGYVAYFNGKSVATSTTYVRNGYLYVALVATLPEFRSRSFAKAITSHSINEASSASGLQRTILHATPMARSMYELLGFRTVTTFPMFLPVALVAAVGAH